MSTMHNASGARRRLGIARAARRAFRLPTRRTIFVAARRMLLVAAFAALSTLALTAQGPAGPGPGGMPGRPGMGMPGAPGGPGGAGRMPPPVGNTPNGNSPGAPTPGRMQGPAGRWWDDSRNAHSVGLTHDQQRRMDAIFQENRSALVSNLDSYRKAQSRLDALSATEHPSEAVLLNEIQNVAQARADLAKASTHMQLQLRNEMTNEQLNKLEKLK